MFQDQLNNIFKSAQEKDLNRLAYSFKIDIMDNLGILTMILSFSLKICHHYNISKEKLSKELVSNFILKTNNLFFFKICIF